MTPRVEEYMAGLWPYQIVQKTLQHRDVLLDLERASTPGARKDLTMRLVRKMGRDLRKRISRLAQFDNTLYPELAIVKNWFCNLDRRVGGRRARKCQPAGVEMALDHRFCAAVFIRFIGTELFKK